MDFYTDTSISKEIKLANEIWQCLLEIQTETNGDREHATVGDIKLFLMAVFGIKGNKRLGIDRPLPSFPTADNNASVQTETIVKLSYGWLNQ